MAKHYIQNIVGGIRKQDMAKISESTTINMYEEVVDSNDSYVNRVLRPCPGYELVASVAGTPRGMYTVSRGVDNSPQTYAVYGNTLYIIYEGQAYKIGTMAQSSSVVHMCETGGYGSAHPHLVVVDGINVYVVNTGLSIADQSVDFRTVRLPLRVNATVTIQPSHCAYAYGYLIVNDAGTDAYYISYQYPFETYSPDDAEYNDIFMVDTDEYRDYGFVTYSEWQPDNTLALASNGSRLYTFGERSYQVWQYNSDVNNPFTSPDTAAQMIGIKAPDSLAVLGTYTMWLGSGDMGNYGVYVLGNGVEARRVSTPNIERIISGMPTVRDAVAFMWQDSQHIFYAISFPSAGKTFVYDILTDSWTERSTLQSDNTMGIWRYGFPVQGKDGKRLYATEGAVVRESDMHWTEHDGNPIVRLRRGGVIFNNYGNFFIDDLEIITNNGQYRNVTGRDVNVSMRYSVDGATFSDVETLNIGKVGEYDYDCVFYDFGMGKEFIIELSCSDDVPFALYGLKINAAECKW